MGAASLVSWGYSATHQKRFIKSRNVLLTGVEGEVWGPGAGELASGEDLLPHSVR